MNILTYQYLHNGAGVSIGDINNDGLSDIFFTANFGPNHLYLNKGDMTFEEIGRDAGIGGKRGWSTGSTMVDINNDGLLDIYVSRSGKFIEARRENALFINNGDLTFTNRAKDYGLNDTGYSSQSFFLDYDRDGDLDMFLLNHAIAPNQENNFFEVFTKRNPFSGDKLFRNDSGKFVDVSEESGIIGNSIGYGLSVSVGDINNDNWPDLYVCNDYLEKDYLYINNRDGSFKEEIRQKIKHISNFSMGSDMADFNNDGHLDIMVADMASQDNYRIKTNMSGMSPERFYRAVDNGLHHQYMMNTLQMNNGDGTFSEVSQLAGLSSTDWSWAPLWADFDNDGTQDLLVTNGLRKEARNNDFVKRKKALLDSLSHSSKDEDYYIQKILKEMPEVQLKNYIFKNEGSIRFSDKTEDWGLTHLSYSNGASYADLDNDGDLDLVISNIDSPAFIYQNNAEQRDGSNYIRFNVNGNDNNTSGLGTRITIRKNSKLQMKEHYLSRGYLSSVEDMLHFGVGNIKKIDTVDVLWPDGKEQQLINIKTNQTLSINYKEATKIDRPIKKTVVQQMTNVTRQSGIGYTHEENEFNDFEKEILLPHKLSNQGPASAVGDINNDGLDDIFLGGAKGLTGQLYTQNKNDGTFTAINNTFLNSNRHSEDVAATFFDSDDDGDLDLYVVSGGNEYAPNSEALQDRLYLNNGEGIFSKSLTSLPKMITSGACVLPGDYDNDGDLDLFIGGRVVPGAYPKAPRSYLLENKKGVFEDVTRDIAPQLVTPGLVTSALWTDFDNDGKQDLLVAGEWMPIIALKNNSTQFTDYTQELGLDNTQGWWFSLAQGDFDNDGDMDYLAGNLGQNYKYQAGPDNTFDIYFDDFDNNNTGDIVLSYVNDGKQYPLRGRECSSQQMPFIKEKFQTYDAFAKASIFDILGEKQLENALHLQAKTFATIYIENKQNESWSIKELPRMTQLSSVNDILVQDIDNDGFLDAVLAGNLYESEVETPRNDASNGIVLKGNGAGQFSSIPMTKSGFVASKNVKNMELLNRKEKKCIVVVNNNDRIDLFQIE